MASALLSVLSPPRETSVEMPTPVAPHALADGRGHLGQPPAPSPTEPPSCPAVPVGEAPRANQPGRTGPWGSGRTHLQPEPQPTLFPRRGINVLCDRCSQPIHVGEPMERTPTHSASAARPDTVVHEQCPRPDTPTIRNQPKGGKAVFLPHPVSTTPCVSAERTGRGMVGEHRVNGASTRPPHPSARPDDSRGRRGTR